MSEVMTAEPVLFQKIVGMDLYPNRLPSESDQEWRQRVADTLGTPTYEAASLLVKAIHRCAGTRNGVETVNGALAMLQEMELTDPIQRMLAVECMLASMAALDAMGSHSQARHEDEREHFTMVANRMGSLSAKLAETLRKLRSGGSQTITVVHVGDNVSNTLVQGQGGGRGSVAN